MFNSFDLYDSTSREFYLEQQQREQIKLGFRLKYLHCSKNEIIKTWKHILYHSVTNSLLKTLHPIRARNNVMVKIFSYVPGCFHSMISVTTRRRKHVRENTRIVYLKSFLCAISKTKLKPTS